MSLVDSSTLFSSPRSPPKPFTLYESATESRLLQVVPVPTRPPMMQPNLAPRAASSLSSMPQVSSPFYSTLVLTQTSLGISLESWTPSPRTQALRLMAASFIHTSSSFTPSHDCNHHPPFLHQSCRGMHRCLAPSSFHSCSHLPMSFIATSVSDLID